MKNPLFMLCVFLGIIACSEDNVKTESKVDIVERITAAGQWSISYYFTDLNKTTTFTGYVFQFSSGGSVTVTGGDAVSGGAWSAVSNDNGDLIRDFSDVQFNLDFTAPDAFRELSEDWEVVSATDEKIELRHVRGGLSDTDFLTFVKI